MEAKTPNGQIKERLEILKTNRKRLELLEKEIKEKENEKDWILKLIELDSAYEELDLQIENVMDAENHVKKIGDLVFYK